MLIKKTRKLQVNSLNITKFSILALILLFTFGCSSSENKDVIEEPVIQEPFENPISNQWDFDTLDGWEDGSQNMPSGVYNYNITDGILKIFTREGTADRPKVRTLDKIYNYGKYTWRVFVPEMGIGDRASIGAFLYHDDTHELDFEIGYGTTALRNVLDAKSDDLCVYMTTQKNPAQSIKKTIKRNNWYTLAIELKHVGDQYYAIWTINGSIMAETYLDFGGETPFKIFCSVENLNFLGDHTATQENYGLFDYVKYEQQH